MPCNTVQQQLIDYYFEELSPEATQQVELHLHQCQSCWAEYLEIKNAMELFLPDSQDGVEQADALYQPLRRHVQRTYGRRWDVFFSYRVPAYLALAAMLLAIIAALLIGSRLSRPGSRDSISSQPAAAPLVQSDSGARGLKNYFDGIGDDSENMF